MSKTKIIAKDKQIRVLVIFGTRPEAIKMAPLAKQLQSEPSFNTKVCVTGQHREMLDQAIGVFDVKCDFDLDIMERNQSLSSISSKILIRLENIFQNFKPDLVLVHGDTTTSFQASLAAFYNNIKIAHVEAGLRTGNIKSPWPEEANRIFISRIADIHFAPTENAKKNLLNEDINEDKIFVTGNTVIDALSITSSNIEKNDKLKNRLIEQFLKNGIHFNGEKRNILITCHRRENIGKNMENIFSSVVTLSQKHKDINFIFPVHPNPKVKNAAQKNLAGIENVFLLEPQDYTSFVFLMAKSSIILSDSGGIQEEAPFFGVPVLILRETTERIEAIEAGTCILAGNSCKNIINHTDALLSSEHLLNSFKNKKNPFGEGNSSQIICKILLQYFEKI